MPGTEFFVGVDLGQMRDFTAVGVVEKTEARVGGRDPVTWEWHYQKRFQLRYLQRLPLGMTYPDMVSTVCRLLDGLAKTGDCTLVVDATGVGAPVVDLFRKAGPKCRIVPVQITGGERESQGEGVSRVPKRDLVTGLQVMFQQQRLEIARRLAEAATLLHELMEMRVRISESGHDSYGCWREGTHDDLVLAVALASWRARRELPGIWGTRRLI